MKTTFFIKSFHQISVTTYNDGDLSTCNGYDLSGNISANNAKSAIEKYFDQYLCFDFDINNALIEDGTIYYDVLCDNDNSEANKEDIALWEKGEKTLYNNSISIEIYELQKIESL